MRIPLKKSMPPAAVAVFAAVFFCAVIMGLKIFLGKSIFDHSPHDQYTLQGLAWLSGRLNIEIPPPHLEMAIFGGKFFVSFPQTPAFFELPFVVLQGHGTFNQLPPLILLSGAIVLMALAFWKITRSFGMSLVFSCFFVLGSNILNGVIQGGVWHFAQVEGFALSMAALALTAVRPDRTPRLAYFLLALAVGCRPFYALYFPLLFLFRRQEARTPIARELRFALGGGSLPLAVFATLNTFRFGVPQEFGHRYLPWSVQLKDGIFSTAYFRRNFYHAVLKLPEFSFRRPHYPVEFDMRGNAFWITNGYLALALLAGLKNALLGRRLLWGALLATLFINGGWLLLHESNGWIQVGYRYAIDLLPLAWLVFWLCFREGQFPRGIKVFFAGFALVSVAINLYAAWWFAGLYPY